METNEKSKVESRKLKFLAHLVVLALLLTFNFELSTALRGQGSTPTRFNLGGFNDLKQISTPSGNPKSGFIRVYAKNASTLCIKDYAGTETCFVGVPASGTPDYLAKFADVNTLRDSLCHDDGVTLTCDGTGTTTFDGEVDITASSPLKFLGITSGSGSIGVADAAGSPCEILIPVTDPSAGQVLTAAACVAGKMQTSWAAGGVANPVISAAVLAANGVVGGDDGVRGVKTLNAMALPSAGGIGFAGPDVGSSAQTSVLGANNRVYVQPYVVHMTRTFTKLSFRVQTGNGNCSVAIYDNSGTGGIAGALVASLANQDCSVSSTVHTGTITQATATVNPGTYYVAWGGDNTTFQLSGFGIATGLGITLNATVNRVGFCANAYASGSNPPFPAACGGVTSSTAGAGVPIVVEDQ